MTITIELPLEVEGELTREAQRQGTTPERLALEGLRHLYTPGQPAPQGSADTGQAATTLSPTRLLFAQWAVEDATDDPEEIARRQREGDELLTALRENPLSLRRVDVSAWSEEAA